MSRLSSPRVPLLPPSTVAGLEPPTAEAVKAAFSKAFEDDPERFRARPGELPALAKQALAAAGRTTGAAYKLEVAGVPFFGAYTYDDERRLFELTLFDEAGHPVASGVSQEPGAAFEWSSPDRHALGVREFAHGKEEAPDGFEPSALRRPRSRLAVRDETPQARVEAHRKTYGDSPIFYPDAFALAVEAVLQDAASKDSPRAVLAQAFTPKALSRELARRLGQGSLALLRAGRTDAAGTDPHRWWIFEVNVDAGSGHTFWARVNRQTGEAHVDGHAVGNH